MIIVHRCTTCQHPGFYHQVGMCSSGFCPCTRTDLGPSETMATYRMGTVEEVQEVVEPGAYWNADSTGPAGSATRMCDCTECREVYDGLVNSVGGYRW
jgi:hypothetical protein